MSDGRGAGTDAGEGEPTLGRLAHDLTEQTRDLVRGEIALARAEVADSVRHAGTGVGLFGGAGIVALYGLAALVTAAIAGLALVVDLWLSALLVGVLLLAVAGVAALLGKGQVSRATPAVASTQANVRRDVATLKEGSGHE